VIVELHCPDKSERIAREQKRIASLVD